MNYSVTLQPIPPLLGILEDAFLALFPSYINHQHTTEFGPEDHTMISENNTQNQRPNKLGFTYTEYLTSWLVGHNP